MSDKQELPEPMTVSQFLLSAGLFEGGLLVVAFVLGWILGVNPTAELQWTTEGFGLGAVATIPMLLLLAACFLSTAGGIRQIRNFLRDVLGPVLDQCRLIDIIFLAMLAGVCEEVLFRGLLYQWSRDWNPTLAIIMTNVLFGLAHSITPLYAWLAGIIGLYLTALMFLGPSPNLLIPITTHTVYDFIAFLVVLWDYRRHHAAALDDLA